MFAGRRRLVREYVARHDSAPERIVITSPANPRIVAAAKLHRSRGRAEAGATLIEGPHLVTEAILSGATIQTIFTVDRDQVTTWMPSGRDVPVAEVTPQVLRKLAGTEHPRGPIAVMELAPPKPPAPTDTVVLMGLADPGNAGTVVRSAAAFGFQVAVGPGTVDLWSPKVMRAGAGGHFRTPITAVGNDAVAELRTVGCWVAALTVTGGVAPAGLPTEQPVAFLLGNEPHGLAADVVAATDAVVSLPMPGGTESLNAAVAASIAMYERRALVPNQHMR